MTVDIDIPEGSQMILVTRPDGTSTISVPSDAFEAAIDKYNLTLISLSSPKMREFLAQPE